MKKLLPATLIALSFMAAQAQSIVNSDLEMWHSVPNTFGGEDPDGWKSTNAATAGANKKGIRKATDAYSGTYALELSPLIAFAGDTIISAIVTGEAPLDFITYKLDYEKGGIAFNKFIQSVNGYYKFSPDAGNFDSAYAVVLLKDQSVITGMGTFAFTPSADYIPFQVDITAQSANQSADTLIIAFFYASNNTTPLPAGKLLIDSLHYSDISTSIDVKDISQFTIYPNPAENLINIDFGTTGNYIVEVISIEGKSLYQTNVVNEEILTLNLSYLPAGIYRINTTDISNGTVQKVNVILQ